MSTSQTLELLKAAMAQPSEALAKAFTQSASPTSGLTYYDLEGPAKSFIPVITPLRNRIPRVSGAGGIQAAWRAVTAINLNNMGIGITEGNRGAVVATQVSDYTASYKGFGLDDSVTFEAEYASQNFDDVKAIAVQNLLRAVMIGEERMILGGNSSLALGTTPTPSLTQANTGGTIANGVVVSVICVALTMEGYLASSIANGLPLSGNRTLGDGTVETYNMGTALKSAAANVTTSGGSAAQSVTATVTAVNGAVAYAWFWSTAGNEVLGAITTTNRVVITTAAGTGTQLASAGFAADRSTNSTHFDGLFSQVMRSGSNALVSTLAAGATLTGDNAGGIVEIDAALQSFWDNYRLTPTDIYVNAQEMKNITAKVLAAASASAQRFMFNSNQGTLAGGTLVRSYLNKYSMDGAAEIPIRLHPNVPPGTVLFYCDTLPYPLSNVTNVLQMRMRRDYYQMEWPRRSRKYEYGVYADGVLQCYFPPAFGVIRNITNG